LKQAPLLAAALPAIQREELIPHIDAKYRNQTTGRTLLGHSLGGFFTLYTMFQTGNDPAGRLAAWWLAIPRLPSTTCGCSSRCG
jgi:hypothetical protein